MAMLDHFWVPDFQMNTSGSDPIGHMNLRFSPSENQRQNTGEMDSYSCDFIWRFPEMGMPINCTASIAATIWLFNIAMENHHL